MIFIQIAEIIQFGNISFEADDTESELAAIPESPQSGSTLHDVGSNMKCAGAKLWVCSIVKGSFEELVPCAMVEEARVTVASVVEHSIATAVVSR